MNLLDVELSISGPSSKHQHRTSLVNEMLNFSNELYTKTVELFAEKN